MAYNQSRRRLLTSIGVTAIGLGTLSTTASAIENCQDEIELDGNGSFVGVVVPDGSSELQIHAHNDGDGYLVVIVWDSNLEDRIAEYIIDPNDWISTNLNVSPGQNFHIEASEQPGTLGWKFDNC